MAHNKIPKKISIDQKPKYKDTVSSVIADIFAAIFLVVGLIMAGNALSDKNDILLAAGIICLISGALLFVISDMAMNIHRMEYTLLSLALQNQEAQKRIIQLLEDNSEIDDE